MEDKQIYEAIKGSTADLNAALRELYASNYPLVENHILSNSGSIADAKDAFQDAIIVLFRNIKNGTFRGDSSMNTYLFSIAKNIWLKHLRSMKKTLKVVSDVSESHVQNPVDLNEQGDDVLEKIFDSLGDVCRQMLTLFYFHNLNLREIADKTGFKNEQNARNKKYKCLKALRNSLDAQPRLKEMLKKHLSRDYD